MNKREQIANRQLWFMLFIVRSIIIIAFLPVLTTANALQDAWISALVTLVGTEFFVLLISLLSVKFPKLTIIEYSQKLLGRFSGKLVSLIILWLFLQVSVMEIRVYGEVITVAFLPNTPIAAIVTLMIIVSSLCVYHGIEVLGRITDFIFFVFILMIIITIVIPIKDANIETIQPVLARGWKPVIHGALTPIALTINMWVIGMLTPVLNKPKKITTIALTSVGASLIVLVIVSFLVISVLGPHEGSRAYFPLLSMIRAIQVTEFIERAEVLIMFAWGFGLFVSISTYLYCGAKGLSQLLNLEDYRPIIFPMAVIWVILSIHGFEEIFDLTTFLAPKTFFPYGLTMLGLPLILLWVSYIIKLTIYKKRM